MGIFENNKVMLHARLGSMSLPEKLHTHPSLVSTNDKNGFHKFRTLGHELAESAEDSSAVIEADLLPAFLFCPFNMAHSHTGQTDRVVDWIVLELVTTEITQLKRRQSI